MGWKEDLKDWGSIAWGTCGILVLVTVFVLMISLVSWSGAITDAKKHFKEKHGVECTCK